MQSLCKSDRMKFLTLLFCFTFSLSTFAAEGFQPSHERNVVMLKSRTSGGTAFVLRSSSDELLLITQAHVIEGHKSMSLQWGHRVASLFRLEAIEPDAYQFTMNIEPIWQDLKLDVAVLKAPNELIDHCQCKGFESAAFQEGAASLVGYPIVARRIWPSTSNWLWMWREIWASVVQQESLGSVWTDGQEYLGDMDSISGNSGGPIIQDGKVIGVIHLLKTWKGEGYRYKNPSLNFVPIEAILSEISKERRAAP